VVDWCGCSPNTFRKKDASRLLSTQSKAFFFARKFEHIVDSDIIDFVEQNLLINGLPLLEESAYFENLFSSKHDNASSLSKAKHEFYSSHGKSSHNLVSTNCILKLSQQNVTIEQFHLEESNIYFKNNKFFGLLSKYQVRDKSKTFATFEIILRQFENHTLLFSTTFKPKLRSIKVGFPYYKLM